MTDILLSSSKFSIPTTLSAAATLMITTISDNNQLPYEYHSIPQFQINDKVWEEQYVPQKLSDDYFDKINAIHQFAVQLIQDSEDIPEEFAKIINEDFWEII